MTANRFNFRAYIKKLNKVYNVYCLDYSTGKLRIKCCDKGGEMIINDVKNEAFNEFFDEEEFELMQSTGKVDKKNNEAFDGDFVKLYDDENIAQIVYSVENARFEYHRKNGDFISALCDIELNKYAEVIGNIYKNKELLGE